MLRVTNKSSPGFYSLLFVIPKKKGKLRLVTDLQSLSHQLMGSHQWAGRISVFNSKSLGSNSSCSVISLGQALGGCLPTATSASQVGALDPVSIATGCSSWALPVVAYNATWGASGLSSGDAFISTTIRSIPQLPQTDSSVRVEVIEHGLGEQQFSVAVPHHLCQTFRALTARIYDCNLGVIRVGVV